MGRKDSQTMCNIRTMCAIRHWDEKELYERSRLILSVYRDVCWSVTAKADEIQSELAETCGSDLDDALIYLETFAPDAAKEQFESRIQSLFETKWLVDLMENTMARIREYPCRGDLYCKILNLCYLNRFQYTENDLLELLNMERSIFYDRKKEAILLFGLSLWGTAIPGLKKRLLQAAEEPFIRP